MIAVPLHYEEPDITLPEAVIGMVEMAESDPVLMYAMAAAWLDPIIFCDDLCSQHPEEIIDGMINVRELWSDHYVDAVELFHHEASTEVEMALISIFNEELPPEMSRWGEYELMEDEIPAFMPLQPVGYCRDMNECEEENPVVLEVIETIGDEMSDPPTYSLARDIAYKLIEETHDHVLENVGWFVMWLYGTSNNTMFDVDTVTFWEAGYNAPEWYEYEFIYAMQQEAFDLHEKAMAGWRALERDERLMGCLIENIEKMKARKDAQRSPKLKWVKYAGDRDAVRSRTQIDSDLLRHRDFHAEGQHGVSHRSLGGR